MHKNSNTYRHLNLRENLRWALSPFSNNSFSVKTDLCYRLTTQLFFYVTDHIRLTRAAYISLLCSPFSFIATDSICKNVQIDLFSIWLKTISFNLNLAALHIFPTNWMRIKWKIKDSFCRNCFDHSSTIRCGQNSLKKLQVADKMLCLEF